MIETDTPSVTRKKEIRQKMLALRRALSATDMEASLFGSAGQPCIRKPIASWLIFL